MRLLRRRSTRLSTMCRPGLFTELSAKDPHRDMAVDERTSASQPRSAGTLWRTNHRILSSSSRIIETNHRIAEFKFSRWQGGAEAIRQNALFKDFYLMAEHPSDKRKYLYVLGVEQPLKFFNSRRSLSSVLSGHAFLQRRFLDKFGEQYHRVRDYYLPRKHLVAIEDVSQFVRGLM